MSDAFTDIWMHDDAITGFRQQHSDGRIAVACVATDFRAYTSRNNYDRIERVHRFDFSGSILKHVRQTFTHKGGCPLNYPNFTMQVMFV